jgi:hypothetical protein
MGWLYELFAILSALLTPFLQNLGIHNIHWIDAIVMFVVTPCCHLMNDEETKGIISDENWYEGIRHMLGIYIEKPSQNVTRALFQPSKQNPNPSQSHNTNPTTITSSLNKVLIRKCYSIPNLLPSQTSKIQKIAHFERRHSFTDIVKASLTISVKGSNITSGTNTGEVIIPESTPTTLQIPCFNKGTRVGSITQLSTIDIT